MTTIMFFGMDQKKLMKTRPLKDIYQHLFMSCRPPLLYKNNQATTKAAPWSNNEDQTFLRCVPDKRTQRELHCETRDKVHQEVSNSYSGVSADVIPNIEKS